MQPALEPRLAGDVATLAAEITWSMEPIGPDAVRAVWLSIVIVIGAKFIAIVSSERWFACVAPYFLLWFAYDALSWPQADSQFQRAVTIVVYLAFSYGASLGLYARDGGHGTRRASCLALAVSAIWLSVIAVRSTLNRQHVDPGNVVGMVAAVAAISVGIPIIVGALHRRAASSDRSSEPDKSSGS